MTAIINIQDEITNEYYCLPKSNGIMDLGYPFWSKNIEDAHDFGSIKSAYEAMNKEDLTDKGMRKPITVAN